MLRSGAFLHCVVVHFWIALDKKHPEVLSQYEKTIRLLEVNPHHPSLRLHRLCGKPSDLHSVSINISYRITLELIFTEKEIIPVEIGSHDEVY